MTGQQVLSPGKGDPKAKSWKAIFTFCERGHFQVLAFLGFFGVKIQIKVKILC